MMKLSKKLRLHRNRDDSAAAAVEFALVLPILLAFLFGIVTYGYILSFHQAITQAATEGARAAAITPVDMNASARANRAKETINGVLDSYGSECDIDGTTCEITVSTCAGDPTRQCATIRVSHNWKLDPKIPNFPLLPTPEKIENSAVIEVS